MSVEPLLQSLQSALGQRLPTILGALAVLIIGWLVAVALRAGIRGLLHRFGLNRRVQGETGSGADVESVTSTLVFWLVVLLTLTAVFNVLDLETASRPLATTVEQVTAYLPKAIAGVVVVLVAWVLATVVRSLLGKLLSRTSLDDRLASSAGMEPMSKHLPQFAFWLVLIVFLPAILGAFEIDGLLAPVQRMTDQMLSVLPDVVAAGAIGFAGWVVAKIVSGLVSSLTASAGLDKHVTRLGLSPSMSLSRLLGTIVFILVFVPALIAALDALQIDALSNPATAMLHKLFDAVPDIFGALVILGLTWGVGRFVADLITRLLAGIGTDSLPAKIGLAGLFNSVPVSVVAGRTALFFAMLFAVAEAAGRVGFEQVRTLVATFIEFGGDVLLGGAILVIGYWLADLAAGAIERSGSTYARGSARIARFAILGLVLGMGLRAMGIADDIVNLAFGLTLGALAVAFALAFGLGGREAAGKLADHWLSRLRKD